MISELQLRRDSLAAITEVIRQMGTVHGRVRIQKMLYFLKRLGAEELRQVDFFYHHYGPFSWTVADSLADGVQCNAFVEDARSSEDDRQLYAYWLGEIEDKVDELSQASRETAKKLVEKVQNEHWRTLELASTIDFLERKEGLSQEDAVSRALGLKPACRDYRDNALSVLSRLDLPR